MTSPQAYHISAPAKVILFGEHAVVYGKTAIAASAGLYTYLSIIPTPTPDIHLVLPDINVHSSWPLAHLHALIPPGTQMPDSTSHLPCSFSTEFHEALVAQIPVQEGPAQSAVHAFLYLTSLILPKDTSSGWKVTVCSEIPVGAGLGSSASYSVCISTALLLASDKIRLGSQKSLPSSPQALNLVNQWALQAETVIHGKPSGVDNYVATHGGAVSYTKGSAPVPLPPFHHLSFLLTHTRVPRDTRRLVEHVRSLTEEYPSIIHPILDAIHAISQECERMSTASPSSFHACLERLIDMNQALLSSLGTSHATLDRIVSLTASYGCHSKLTGAGGGGCSLTLLPSSDTDLDATSTQEIIRKALEEELGFPSWQVDIAGPGVRAMPYSSSGKEDADHVILTSLLTSPPSSTSWRPLHLGFNE